MKLVLLVESEWGSRRPVDVRCPGEDGTEHRLLICPALRVEREKARKNLLTVDSRLPFNMSTLIGLWGVGVGDMSRVLKILSDFMDSLPGMREGFVETRRVIKKPISGGVLGDLLVKSVKPVGPKKRKRKVPSDIEEDIDEPQLKYSRKSKKSIPKISRLPPKRKKFKRTPRPDLPVSEEPADITLEPLTESDLALINFEFFM